jgi:2-polyprenyl-6-methoxyphenol hydroxylase-like FAD-dependent oxidoreductase
MTERIDGVIVAGAGPVGLVAALKLAREGVPILVVDAESEIVRLPRAVVYHSVTVEELDRMGLLDDLKAVGIVKQDYQFRTVTGDILCKPHMSVLRPDDTAYPFNLHLAQHELAGIILRHFEDIAGAEVRWNTRVTGVEQDATGVTVTVEAEGGASQLRCNWLIGADGGRSGVRRALGLSFDGRTHADRFVSTNVVYDFEARGFARANFIVDPVHWAVIVKINKDGLWRVTYGEDASLPEASVRERVPEHYKHLLPDSDPYELEAVSPFRVHERCVEQFRIGRVLMAGDAAHVCNPLGGLGLTSGLLDAMILGDALSAVIAGRAGEELLDRYAQERRRVFTEVTGPTAAENKRRLSETDPEKKRADNERFRMIREDSDFQRQMLTFTYRLKGNPIGVPAP